jgi:hypothetical protein
MPEFRPIGRRFRGAASAFSDLARTMPDWLGICAYADVRPAER